jgi:TetR/AcrR family transcriptional regulator, cholesterol catabolism regulator
VSTVDAAATEELGSASQRERRRRILDATILLASQGGFDAVQMRTVAEQADVALGTLYRYFPSKIHLLVSALELLAERAGRRLASQPVPGETPAERVIHVVRSTSRGLKGDQHLTEALTRAFMFADRSVQQEIHSVGLLLTSMLTRAMHPDHDVSTDEDVAVARVIGDVWLSSLVAWVTGRSTEAEATEHLERAIRMLLR